MTYNIGDLPQEQRERLQRERVEALEQYGAQKALADDIEREYQLILSERGRLRDGWPRFVHQELAKIRCERVRVGVHARVNAFQEGIAAGRI